MNLFREIVLVTGATGFIGAQVTRELLAQGRVVYAIVRDRNRLLQLVGTEPGERLKILQGDLLEAKGLDALRSQLSGLGSVSAVIHTVGGGPLTRNQKFSDDIFDLNLRTTENLMAVLEAAGQLSSLSLFVYFSSLAAMGVPRTTDDTIFYHESAACEPVLPYEKAKLQTEEFLEETTRKHHFRTVVLRFPQVYGNEHDALAQMIGLIRRGVFPVVRGRVGSLPLLHVRDAARATCAVVRNHHSVPGGYEVNLLSEKSYSYDEIKDLVIQKYGTGRLIRLPYSLFYALVLVTEILFRVAGKPEPLNRHRLLSLTKKRAVDSRKFVKSFEYQFENDLASFLAAGESAIPESEQNKKSSIVRTA